VAKEYVACQRGGAGVLVLSEFAGAAAEMGEAVLVNPYDEERTAAAVQRALALPVEERRERMEALYRRVTRNNAFAWAERFVATLAEAAAERQPARAGEPLALPLGEAIAAFRDCRHALLLMDYDGTLVPVGPRPTAAVPPSRLRDLIAVLSRDGRHKVAIVSGRPREHLARFFDGIPGLWLAAEHGAVVRAPGTPGWVALRPVTSHGWKARATPLLEHFVDRTPGSFIEEKEYSLVWHFRMADPEFGEWLANELVANLEEMLAETELRAVRGHKSVEVRLAWANKGEAVRHIEASGPEPDFRLALGDDRTDEDVFDVMPPEAWTVHVGPGTSRARHQLATPADVHRLLEGFVAAVQKPAGVPPVA
jgi:trehalose 6-phosphate synthase/phosphatase